MAAVINTNIASLNTQRNLSSSQSALNTSIQRLSSGLRINSSKDDAAGLAIATRMDSQLRGMNVAIRNSNDAISFSQTAEGGLSKVTDALQRMRELAVQSANSTNTTDDRTNLNAEFKQLQEEITRITGNTNFNGVNTLAGGTKSFQVGANTTDVINVAGTDLTASTSKTSAAAAAVTVDATAAVLATDPIAATTSAYAGVTYAAVTAGTAGNAYTIAFAQGGTAVPTAAVSGNVITVTADFGAAATTNISMASIRSAITGTNLVTATGTTGADISTNGVPTTLTFTGGAATGATPAAAVASTGLAVTTAANASSAITQIDAALSEVNTERATYGAIQNRFESVIGNLQVSAENQAAAKSRIMDADFASETANLTRGQILQQAGTAMLAQANSLPNGVLALLRG
jgi:flagellin